MAERRESPVVTPQPDEDLMRREFEKLAEEWDSAMRLDEAQALIAERLLAES